MNLAEEFIVQHPGESKTIAINKLKLTNEDVSAIWSRNQCALSLDQSLVAAMEDDARWMIINNMTFEKNVPNFNDYIYEEALQVIKPNTVNTIR